MLGGLQELSCLQPTSAMPLLLTEHQIYLQHNFSVGNKTTCKLTFNLKSLDKITLKVSLPCMGLIDLKKNIPPQPRHILIYNKDLTLDLSPSCVFLRIEQYIIKTELLCCSWKIMINGTRLQGKIFSCLHGMQKNAWSPYQYQKSKGCSKLGQVTLKS